MILLNFIEFEILLNFEFPHLNTLRVHTILKKIEFIIQMVQ